MDGQATTIDRWRTLRANLLALMPYIPPMTTGKTFTAEQLHRLYTMHSRICAMRDVTLLSAEGRQIAKRLLSEFSGAESEAEIMTKFIS
jgi:hypothetical protein